MVQTFVQEQDLDIKANAVNTTILGFKNTAGITVHDFKADAEDDGQYILKNFSGATRAIVGVFADNCEIQIFNSSSVIDTKFAANSASYINAVGGGSLGIGTISPSHKVHIAGTSPTLLKLDRGGQTGIFTLSSDGAGAFFSLGVDGVSDNLLRIRNSGNIGIANRLLIGASNVDTLIRLEVIGAANTNENFVFFKRNNSIIAHNFFVDSSGHSGFDLRNAGGGVEVNLTTAQDSFILNRFAVGRLDPQRKFHVFTTDPNITRFERSTFTAWDLEIDNDTVSNFLKFNAVGGGTGVKLRTQGELLAKAIRVTTNDVAPTLMLGSAGTLVIPISATITDAVLGDKDGAIAIDTANNRFRFRAGNSWVSVANVGDLAVSAGGWTDDGTIVRLTVGGDDVLIGNAVAGNALTKLTVVAVDVTSVASVATAGRLLTVANTATSSNHCAIGIQAGTAGNAIVYFGDKDNQERGFVQYVNDIAHTAESMVFNVALGKKLELTQDGRASFNSASTSGVRLGVIGADDATIAIHNSLISVGKFADFSLGTGDLTNTGLLGRLRSTITQTAGSLKSRLSLIFNSGNASTEGLALESDASNRTHLQINRTSEVIGDAVDLDFMTGTPPSSSTNFIGLIRCVITAANPNPLKSEMQLSVNSGDTILRVMTFTDTGNVGIATTSPQRDLHVVDRVGDGFLFRLDKPVVDAFDFQINNDTVANFLGIGVVGGATDAIKLRSTGMSAGVTLVRHLVTTTTSAYAAFAPGSNGTLAVPTVAGTPADATAGDTNGGIAVDTTNNLMYFRSGSWIQLATGTTAAGWTDDGTTVRLTTAADKVSIGNAIVRDVKLKLLGAGLTDNDNTLLLQATAPKMYFETGVANKNWRLRAASATQDLEIGVSPNTDALVDAYTQKFILNLSGGANTLLTAIVTSQADPTVKVKSVGAPNVEADFRARHFASEESVEMGTVSNHDTVFLRNNIRMARIASTAFISIASITLGASGAKWSEVHAVNVGTAASKVTEVHAVNIFQGDSWYANGMRWTEDGEDLVLKSKADTEIMRIKQNGDYKFSGAQLN